MVKKKVLGLTYIIDTLIGIVLGLCIGVFISVRISALLLSVFGIESNFYLFSVFASTISTLSAYLILKARLYFIKKTITKHLHNYNLFNLFLLITGVIFAVLAGNYLVGKNTEYSLTLSKPISVMSEIGAGVLLFLFLYCLAGSLKHVLSNARNMFVDLKKSFFFAIVSVLLIDVAAAVYLANSAQVYFWDTSGYWEISIHLSKLMFSNPKQFIISIMESILTLDYNYIGAVPIAFVMRIFGTSRLVFILSIINLYLLPGIFLLTVFINRVVKGISESVYLLFLLFPSIPYLAILGFIDVFGIAIISAIYTLYFYSRVHSMRRVYFLIGLLLVSLYLFRRWYMFWVVSFLIILALYELIKFIGSLRGKKPCLLRFVTSIGITGTAMMFTLFFFVQPLVVNKLLKPNYSVAYSAYDLGVFYDLFSLIRHFGLFVIILFFVCSLLLALYKNTRASSIFILLQTILCFFIFRQVQSHGQQHFIMYIPGAFIIFILAFRKLFEVVRKPKHLKIILTVLTVVFTANTAVVFYNDGKPQPQTPLEVKSVTFYPNFKLLPKVRYDMPELLRLIYYLDNLSENNTKRIALLSSSLVLNNDILNKAEMSVGIPSKNNNARAYMYYFSHVDMNSSFPFGLFEMDYMVVANPVQYHLRPEDQRVVGIPAESFLDGTDISKAFIKLDESFELQDNIKVYIYKRIRENTLEEKRELVRKLWVYYRELDDKYPSPDSIDK